MSSDNNINNNSGNQTPRFNKLDNLKNNIAAKAATAAGGPMAGKAVETLNKIRNNPNNNGYTSNKNNRIGQANSNNSNTSDKPSDLDNNSSNGDTNTKQNSNNNPLGRLGSMLGGNNSNKINENDSTSAKAVKTVRKIRNAMPIIAALAPFIISFLGLIIVVVIVMSQFAAIENFVAQIQVGVEKMLNFATGEGWTTNENAFFKRLQEENITYKRFSNNGENLDLPLVAATIHYDRIVDINTYEQKSAGNETYNPDNGNSVIVSTAQTASFYGVASDMLGKVNSLVPGNKKLLGHLVKVDVKWVDADGLDNALNGWRSFFGQYGDQMKEITGDTVGETCANGANTPLCLVSYFQQLVKMKIALDHYTYQYDDILAYPKFSLANITYEASETRETFKDIFNDSEKVNEGNTSSWYKYPQITYTMDYETYKKYLKNVFIPFTIYQNVEITDEINIDIDNMIDEIFAQRDYYNYLFHNENKENSSCELADSTTESVNVDTSYIENLKIKVLNPSCGKSITCSNVEFTVSLKEYVMGVVYREIGVSTSTPVEALKANLIAAKSYTLGRRTPKNGYITMRNNTYDQVYCNLESGCMHYSSNRKPAPSAAVRKYLSDAYDAVANEFLYNTSSNSFTGSYRDTKARCASDGEAGKCLGQNESKSLAKQGQNYNEILSTFYTGTIGVIDIGTKTVSFNVYDCLEYSSSSGLLTGGNYSSTAPVFANEKSFFANVNYNYYKSKAAAGRLYGECPWYAKGRAIEIVAYSNMPDDLKNKVINSLRNTNGNGADWYKNPSSTYFGKSTDLYAAKPGSIVSWSGGKNVCAGGCGHVGIIEDVKYDSNGKATQVLLTDGYNGTGNPANAHYTSRWMSIEKLKIYSTRRNYRFNGYVYLLG